MNDVIGTLRRVLRWPERGRSGPWLVALGIALILSIQPIWRDSVAIGIAGTLALALIAAARWQLRWVLAIVLVGCGIALRLALIDSQPASDVSDVTEYAIRTLLAGGDPYGVGYNVSRPAGAAFPYGPVALLWYLPSYGDPAFIEFLVSVALLVYFGLRAVNGRPIGLAIFAVAPPLVLASMDGSNDTSAGVLILLAMALLAARPALGAAVLAVAVAFKPYAAAWLLPMVAWAGVPAAIGFVIASVIAWAPVLFMWGPGSYLRSLAMAQETHLRESYWSVAAILDGISPGLAPRALETARYFVSGAIAFFGARRVRSLDGVIVVGTLSFLVAQFGGYFGSYVYLAAVAPLLCWRVDDWLRMGLPELTRAYAEWPDIGRRVRRPAATSTPALPNPVGGAVPAPRLGRAQARVLSSVVADRDASPSRPSRTPTG
ncbi:MAG TPA: hypothetical protein VM451_03925 [Candidatus Limnocylindria bacterium]|nr:hypothetical protein [Candidatus Limnocylindria bacterium]